MPELPEVETICRELNAVLRHKTVKDIELRYPKVIRGQVLAFRKAVVKAKVVEVKRRAKLIIFVLSNAYCFLVHLKMTGQLVYRKNGKMRVGGHPIKDGTKDLPSKFTRVIFSFAQGEYLFFNDIRKFGYMQLAPKNKLDDFFNKTKYGPEPFAKNFTLEAFKQMLAKKKTTKIKPLLMDQTFISGIGNIYAAEACFYAGILPTRPAGGLTDLEMKKLYIGIRAILTKAISKQGSSPDNFVDAYGNPGHYVPFLKVYGRGGEKCLRCGGTVKNIVLAGRGTTYCPDCQY
jgi:formamidopyrimidine-DNA glycosylase